VLARREVPVQPGDDEAALHERIKTVERELLVQTVAQLATAGRTRESPR
jgi:phosphoribosylglycinamide formyltransferase-1